MISCKGGREGLQPPPFPAVTELGHRLCLPVMGPEGKWVLTLPEGAGYMDGQNWEGGGRVSRSSSHHLPSCTLTLALSQGVKLSFLEAVGKLLSRKTEESLQPHQNNFGKVFILPCFLLVRLVSFPAQLQWTVASLLGVTYPVLLRGSRALLGLLRRAGGLPWSEPLSRLRPEWQVHSLCGPHDLREPSLGTPFQEEPGRLRREQAERTFD